MRRIVVGIGLALVCAGAHAECLKANVDGQVAEGKLSSSVFTTPAYNLKEQAYLLTLAKAACLDGEDEYDKVEKSTRIHVYSTDDKLRKQMRALVGKTVQVHGSPFGEATAHHHAPIVMGISAIEAVKKR